MSAVSQRVKYKPFSSYLVPLFENDVLVVNLSFHCELDLHQNDPVGGTHFQMNRFEQGLVLAQRQKKTRKRQQQKIEGI